MKIYKTNNEALIKRLQNQFLDEFEPYEQEEELLLWWVAENKYGEPVGYAGLDVSISNSEAFMCRCAVLPSYRGQGLQKRFLSRRESAAKQAGISRVWSYADVRNVASMNSMIRKGYKTFLPAQDYSPDFIYFYKNIK